MKLLLIPLILHGLAILVDEFWYHQERRLPRWERIGHPLDTLSFLACMACIFLFDPVVAWRLYLGLAVVSCVLITKDEWIHSSHCPPGENWLHAILYLLHPVILGILGWYWWLWRVESEAFAFQVLVISGIAAIMFFIYQLIYWNFLDKPLAENPSS